jgi:hypothetical protein
LTNAGAAPFTFRSRITIWGYNSYQEAGVIGAR